MAHPEERSFDMQHYDNCLILTLPDQSTTVMDCRTLSFYCFSQQESLEETIRERISNAPRTGGKRHTGGIDLNALAAFMETPHLSFADCFRRCGSQECAAVLAGRSEQPRYSFRSAKQDFDVKALTSVYQEGYVSRRHVQLVRTALEISRRRYHRPQWLWMGRP
jgi:hypothetical protein